MRTDPQMTSTTPTVTRVLDSLNFSQLLIRYPALQSQEENILLAINCMIDAVKNDHRIWIFGNGGSSADAEHFSGELTKSFVNKRALNTAEKEQLNAVDSELARHLHGGISAIALSTQSSSLSAFSNDVGFHYALAQLVWAVGKKEDIAIGLTTSGNSENIFRALQAARAKGLMTIALTGNQESRCKAVGHITIQAPTKITHEVQEFHLPIYHSICLEIENFLWS